MKTRSGKLSFLLAAAIAGSDLASCQIENVTSMTPTPTPGSGHDYIHMLRMPAFGQVAHRIIMMHTQAFFVSSAVIAASFAQAEQSSQQPGNPQAATSPQPIPKTVRISSGVAQANLTHRVEPSYPTEAKVKGIEGDVDLQILIDTGGWVKQIQPVSGDPILIAAAVAAVKQWTYKPTLLKGEPVNVQTMVKVRFQMSHPRAKAGESSTLAYFGARHCSSEEGKICIVDPNSSPAKPKDQTSLPNSYC